MPEAFSESHLTLYVVFSMIEQVRLCAVWHVWPTENWLGSFMNHMQSLMTV